MPRYNPWPALEAAFKQFVPEKLTREDLEMVVRKYTPIWRSEQVHSLVKSIIAKGWVVPEGDGFRNVLYQGGGE
jgi:hypothetical protein